MSNFNFTSQTCTTKEQSQRLLELGLKPETADMYHTTFYRDNVGYEIIQVRNEKLPLLSQELPAWSLHRLKCLLPTKIPYASGYLTTEIINNVNLMFITDTFEQKVISFIHEDLYESMIKCIKWLINENYFNKEYLK